MTDTPRPRRPRVDELRFMPADEPLELPGDAAPLGQGLEPGRPVPDLLVPGRPLPPGMSIELDAVVCTDCGGVVDRRLTGKHSAVCPGRSR